MFYTYVIRSKKDRKFYTGATKDLRKRFNEHNGGKVFSTKGRRPFELIYYEACIKMEDAIARENYIKKRTKRFLSGTGFTLIEVVIVILLVAILSVMAIPSMIPLSSMRLRLSANQVQSDIRYTQSFAASIQKRTRIIFNSGTDSYTVEIEDSPGSWITAKDKLGQADFIVQLNSGTYSGIDITGVSFNGDGVIFDKWGNPYDLSGTALIDSTGVELNSSLNIIVKKATGRVNIQ